MVLGLPPRWPILRVPAVLEAPPKCPSDRRDEWKPFTRKASTAPHSVTMQRPLEASTIFQDHPSGLRQNKQNARYIYKKWTRRELWKQARNNTPKATTNTSKNHSLQPGQRGGASLGSIKGGALHHKKQSDARKTLSSGQRAHVH